MKSTLGIPNINNMERGNMNYYHTFRPFCNEASLVVNLSVSLTSLLRMPHCRIGKTFGNLNVFMTRLLVEELVNSIELRNRTV